MWDSSYEGEHALKSSKPFRELSSQCGKDITMEWKSQELLVLSAGVQALGFAEDCGG